MAREGVKVEAIGAYKRSPAEREGKTAKHDGDQQREQKDAKVT